MSSNNIFNLDKNAGLRSILNSMNDKINKTQFIEEYAEKFGISKSSAERYLNGLISLVSDKLIEGTEVNFTGFGSFSIRKRKARQGVNPKTGERMDIKASQSVGFKVGKKLRDAVRVKF